MSDPLSRYQTVEQPWAASQAPASDDDVYDASRTLQRQDNSDAADRRMYAAYAPMVDAVNAVRRREGLPLVLNPMHGIRAADPRTVNPRGSAYGFAGQVTVGQDAAQRDVAMEVARIRRARPDFLKGVEADPAKVMAAAIARDRATRAKAQNVVARGEGVGSTVAQFAGGAVASLEDPAVLATIPFGGGGKTLAQVAAREFMFNAATTALMQPIVAQNRAVLGDPLTFREGAENSLMAGVVGAGIGGAAHGLFHVLPQAGTLGELYERNAAAVHAALPESLRQRWPRPTDIPDHAVPAVADAIIGRDRFTPDQQAAAHVLDRQAEVDATNPFKPDAAGREAHAGRLDRAAASVLRGRPVGAPDPFQNMRAPGPVMGARAESFSESGYLDRLSAGESGGDYHASAKTSSAYGRYQITRGTWLRYAREFPAYADLDDAGLWALRTNPGFQDLIQGRMVADQRKALAQIGARETYGNLYVLHFAGDGAGKKILRAAPDTPIGELMSAAAIDANPFLRGRTAGEVIDWAHAKMRDPVTARSGPTLRRDHFDADDAGDADWMEAQQAIDAEEAELRSGHDTAPPESVGDYVDRYIRGEGRDSPVMEQFGANNAEAIEAEFRRRAAEQPSAVPFDDVPFDDGDAPRAASFGRDPFEGMDDPIAPRPTEPVKATVAADATGPTMLSSVFVAPKGEPGFHIEDTFGDGSFVFSVFRDAEGAPKGVVQFPLAKERGEYDAVTSFVDPQYRREGIATRLYDQLRDAGYPIDAISGTGDLTPSGARLVNSRRAKMRDTTQPARSVAAEMPLEAASRPVRGATWTPSEAAIEAEAARPFDDPESAAAIAQGDGIVHDLEAAIDTGALGDVAFAVDGVAQSIGDDAPIYASARVTLDRLAKDDAAFAALEACL